MIGRMLGGPNPAITGTAIGGALGVDHAAAAGARDLEDERSALDRADLRELERAQYHAVTPAITEPAIRPRRRSLLDRLFRR